MTKSENGIRLQIYLTLIAHLLQCCVGQKIS